MSTVFHYGIPYMGNKDQIAQSLIRELPSGKRFCDLFSGGFAMSHAAFLSDKWDEVLYNEFNPLVFNLIKDALAGKYNYKVFKPEFITKERFKAEKDKDGYIKYIWSFGNKGDAYMFSAEAEEIKRKGHEYVIECKPFDGFKVIGNTPVERRMNLRRLAGIRIKEMIRRNPALKKQKRHLEARYELEQLERLERLAQLERLERLELNNGDYRAYKYRIGDIVYCDPPYEGTAKYNEDVFNHQEFSEWVYTRDFPVYFSSYEISDNRFELIFAKRRMGTLGATNAEERFERLWANRKGARLWQKYHSN